VADFYITEVGFDVARKKATHLSVRHNLITHLSRPVWIDREQVITAIRRGYTGELIIQSEAGSGEIGMRVFVVNANGEYFLRTDQKLSQPMNWGWKVQKGQVCTVRVKGFPKAGWKC
jgi:hypothetical protein